jgi:lysophospholipase L1-like esterase
VSGASRRAVGFRVSAVVLGLALAAGVAALVLHRRSRDRSDRVLAFDQVGQAYVLPDLRRAQVVIPGRPHRSPVELTDPEQRRRVTRRTTFRVSTDSRGFRGDVATDEATPGTVRIGCAGDSVTFGWGVEDHEAFPAVLAELLSADGPHEALNAAVPSHDSMLIRDALERDILPLRPHWVTLCAGVNDVAMHFTGPNPDIDGFRLVASRRPVVRRTVANSLRSMIRSCRAQGATPIVLAPPYSSLYAFPDIALTGEAARAAAQELGAAWIDLAALLQEREAQEGLILVSEGTVQRLRSRGLQGVEELLSVDVGPDPSQRVAEEIYTYLDREPVAQRYFIDGCHPTAAGHRLIAEALAELMRTQP